MANRSSFRQVVLNVRSFPRSDSRLAGTAEPSNKLVDCHRRTRDRGDIERARRRDQRVALDHSRRLQVDGDLVRPVSRTAGDHDSDRRTGTKLQVGRVPSAPCAPEPSASKNRYHGLERAAASRPFSRASGQRCSSAMAPPHSEPLTPSVPRFEGVGAECRPARANLNCGRRAPRGGRAGSATVVSPDATTQSARSIQLRMRAPRNQPQRRHAPGPRRASTTSRVAEPIRRTAGSIASRREPISTGVRQR